MTNSDDLAAIKADLTAIRRNQAVGFRRLVLLWAVGMVTIVGAAAKGCHWW